MIGRYGNTQVERLCAALLHLESFEDVDPQYPLGGPDGLKDVRCNRNRIDYLMPTEPFRYSIHQYRCTDLKALEQKLLQFRAGSTFSIARTGSVLDGLGD